MMRPQFSSAWSLRSSAEGGTVILLTAIVLVVVLAMAALAIDAGNLFRNRIALQKAADAAALAAVGYAIYSGEQGLSSEALSFAGDSSNSNASSSQLGSLLSDKIQELIAANLEAQGMNSGVTIDASYEANDDTSESGNIFDFKVSLTKKVPYLLMQAVPIVSLPGTESTITASASARRRVANLAVMLDFSDSMNCPAAGACTCLTESRSAACSSPLRVDRLIEAAKTFIKMFDVNTDRVAAVPFNIAAQPFYLPETMSGYPNITDDEIDTLVDGFKKNPGPGSSTNVCDALMRSYSLMKNKVPNEEISYIIFTDGAPTAGRFLFAHPTGLAPWSVEGVSGQYDYTHYSIDWVDSKGAYPGPSLLAQTGLIKIGLQTASPNTILGSSPAFATCGTAGTAGSAPTVTDSKLATLKAAVISVFKGCVTDLGFKMPDSTVTTVYASGTNPDDSNIMHWRKQYYNCAVALTDFMRQNLGNVYVIGLGSPNSATDFYQDINDAHARKDHFLARIANDYIEATAAMRADPVNGKQFPEPSFTGAKTYDELSGSGRRGRYLYTTDANELKRLFAEMGKKIQLKLVQ